MSETVKVLISAEELQKKVAELGAEIHRDYEGKNLFVISILKGGVYAFCDITRAIDLPMEMDFMAVSSYGNGTESSGQIKILKDLDTPLDGRDVLVIEDIVDSGKTLNKLLALLKKRNPASLRLCAMLNKPDRRAQEAKDLKIDYLGFEIPDVFVAGYGLDYAQRYRNLPYIGEVCFDGII